MKNILKSTLTALALTLTLAAAQPAHADLEDGPNGGGAYGARPVVTQPAPDPATLHSVGTRTASGAHQRSAFIPFVDHWAEQMASMSDSNYYPLW